MATAFTSDPASVLHFAVLSERPKSQGYCAVEAAGADAMLRAEMGAFELPRVENDGKRYRKGTKVVEAFFRAFEEQEQSAGREHPPYTLTRSKSSRIDRADQHSGIGRYYVTNYGMAVTLEQSAKR